MLQNVPLRHPLLLLLFCSREKVMTSSVILHYTTEHKLHAPAILNAPFCSSTQITKFNYINNCCGLARCQNLPPSLLDLQFN